MVIVIAVKYEKYSYFAFLFDYDQIVEIVITLMQFFINWRSLYDA